MDSLINRSSKKALVLGAGYLGKHLISQLQQAGYWVDGTHRRRPLQQDIEFRMEDPNTWKNLGSYDETFMTLALDQDLMQPYLDGWIESVLPRLGKVVVISTTSLLTVLPTTSATQLAAASEKLNSRNEAEKLLRNHGAQIVYSSGICGAHRHPGLWLKSQRIATLNKWVNLIHVEDLACIAIAANRETERGETYIATSAKAYMWSDIFTTWLNLHPDSIDPDYAARLINTLDLKSPPTGKRLDGSETLRRLTLKLNFPDLLDWLKMA